MWVWDLTFTHLRPRERQRRREIFLPSESTPAQISLRPVLLSKSHTLVLLLYYYYFIIIILLLFRMLVLSSVLKQHDDKWSRGREVEVPFRKGPSP